MIHPTEIDMSSTASSVTGSIAHDVSKDYTKTKKTSKITKIMRGIRKNGAMGVVTAPISNHSKQVPTDEEDSFVIIGNSQQGKATSDKSIPLLPKQIAAADGIIRMDKYGFLLGDKTSTDSHHTPVNNDSDMRLVKWHDMLERVPKSKSSLSFSNTQSKVKYYTRRGLPDSMRSKAWTVLTGVDVIMAQRQGEYEGLVRKAEEEVKRRTVYAEDDEDGKIRRRDSEVSALGDTSVSNAVLETIDRDIHRTFPKHYLFHNGLEDQNDEGLASGVGSMGELDEIDRDSDEEEDEDDENDENSSVDNEMTDENKMEKKKLFDDMIEKSLNLSSCGNLNNVHSNENEKSSCHEEKEKSVASDQSPTVVSSGSLEGYGAGQAALRRILRAYSIYDSEVGYCQGMNFIAAMFLTFLSEEEAFWLLVIVMNEEPYRLRELFGEDMAGTHEVLYIAEKLLQQFLPKLSQHMDAESIHISMFVTQWLLTVYTSTFPFELVSKVWDSFLVEGWKVVYRVMLALMEAASSDIMTYSFEQILNYFRDFPKTVEGDKIMNASLKIPLKRKHIQKHVAKWRRGDIEDQSKTSSGMMNPFRRHNSQESNMSGTIGSNGSGNKSSTKRRKFKRRVSRDILVEDLSNKLLPILGSSKFAILIQNALSPEECNELIALAEGSGFQPAAIYDAATKTVHRNCTRRIIDDSALAEDWFERILQALNDTPHKHKVKECPWIGNKQGALSLRAICLNERLRVVKYSQGQFFTKHQDAAFTRGSEAGDREGETALVSVHMYLNEGYKGGVTRFHGGSRSFDVKTKQGSILLFESTIPHEAVKVTKGEKYVIRSDVMYSAKTDLTDVAGTGFTQQL